MLNFPESRGFQSELWTLLFQMNASFSAAVVLTYYKPFDF